MTDGDARDDRLRSPLDEPRGIGTWTLAAVTTAALLLLAGQLTRRFAPGIQEGITGALALEPGGIAGGPWRLLTWVLVPRLDPISLLALLPLGIGLYILERTGRAIRLLTLLALAVPITGLLLLLQPIREPEWILTQSSWPALAMAILAVAWLLHPAETLAIGRMRLRLSMILLLVCTVQLALSVQGPSAFVPLVGLGSAAAIAIGVRSGRVVRRRIRIWRLAKEVESAVELHDRVDDLLETVRKEGLDALTPRQRRLLRQASRNAREAPIETDGGGVAGGPAGRMEEPDLHRQVDRLLEKIAREGESSLTDGERRFLLEASERFRRRRIE